MQIIRATNRGPGRRKREDMNEPKLTPDEIAAGLEVCEAATEGPWEARTRGYENLDPDPDDKWDAIHYGIGPDCPVKYTRHTIITNSKQAAADADFIFLARDLLPRALHELQDANDRIAELEALIRRNCDPGDATPEDGRVIQGLLDAAEAAGGEG